ncbi:hypothetical protein PCC7424_5496 (plasmid) [Gloeothece citriformis PCC 7424]|uniref:Uncharacterized protein n=1 Tax=Gloeothece citriformis (strain PCC 7424) TaxID=65393 RepID=B7KMP3_GLOC7|nr:hypothetical protein [Gloeothece citriformis]ACK74065.1 hypothetical protein PCC7424_5496 [Gloeothece citriformis PCC 7424]
MNKKKKDKYVNLNYVKETHEEKVIKFFIKRLIEIVDNPQLIWQITKDPTNIFRTTDEQLEQILKGLEEKVKSQELNSEIYEKIKAAINREK